MCTKSVVPLDRLHSNAAEYESIGIQDDHGHYKLKQEKNLFV